MPGRLARRNQDSTGVQRGPLMIDDWLSLLRIVDVNHVSVISQMTLARSLQSVNVKLLP